MKFYEKYKIQVEIHPHKCYIMFNMMSVVKNVGALIDRGNGKREAFVRCNQTSEE